MEGVIRNAQADNAMLRAQILQLKAKLLLKDRKTSSPKRLKLATPTVIYKPLAVKTAFVTKSAAVVEPTKLRRRCLECESLLADGHSSVGCKKHWLRSY